jgi:hypothetical protein
MRSIDHIYRFNLSSQFIRQDHVLDLIHLFLTNLFSLILLSTHLLRFLGFVIITQFVMIKVLAS